MTVKLKQNFEFISWAICGLAAIFYCYEYLLRVSPSVMLPELMRTFGVSAASLGLLTSAYYYAYTPLQLPVGLMMDRFGPRRILTVAVFCCALGSAMFGFTNQFWVAVTARFLMGFGSAFAFVGVLKLATIWLPPNRFAMISGLTTALGMLGAISGELILSKMVKNIGWEQTMIYSGAIGIVLMPFIWTMIRDARDTKGAYKPPTVGYRDFIQDTCRVFLNRQIWLNGIIGGLLFLPLSVFSELWGIEYLRAVHHLSIDDAAMATSMIFLGWAVGGPILGLWSDRIQRRKMPILLGTFIAIVLLCLVMYCKDLPIYAIWGGFFAFGIACGVQVITFAIGRENCPLRVAGTAIATTNFLVMLWGAFFQPLVGKILDMVWAGDIVDGIPLYTAQNYQVAMIILPVGLLLGLLCTCFLKETACQQVE